MGGEVVCMIVGNDWSALGGGKLQENRFEVCRLAT